MRDKRHIIQCSKIVQSFKRMELAHNLWISEWSSRSWLFRALSLILIFQVCLVHLQLEQFSRKSVEIEPKIIEMLSPIELTQYSIQVRYVQLTILDNFSKCCCQKWTLEYMDPDTHSSGLKMEIIFKRRIMNELLTTYLPSCLLLLISYSTTFFKPFYFEAQVTVNLSVMLVTTNLFIRF